MGNSGLYSGERGNLKIAEGRGRSHPDVRVNEMEFFDLPVPDPDEVLEPEKALSRVNGLSPLDVLTKSTDFELRLSTVLGIDLNELKRLEREGHLERLLSTSYYAVALKALESLAGAISNGELTPEALIKASVELSKTAYRLSGREVHKHLVLNEERLLELLTEEGDRESPSKAEARRTEFGEQSSEFSERNPEDEVRGQGEALPPLGSRSSENRVLRTKSSERSPKQRFRSLAPKTELREWSPNQSSQDLVLRTEPLRKLWRCQTV